MKRNQHISIIQFENIGAVYNHKDELITDYTGEKPTPEINQLLSDQFPNTTQIIYLFRLLHISSPKWPFLSSLGPALEEIKKIQGGIDENKKRRNK